MTTLEQKVGISFGSAILFAGINMPQTYGVSNSILNGVVGPLVKDGCPTHVGLLIHTLIFGLITFLTMGNIGKNTWLKVKYSFYGTLIFFLLSSQTVYSIVGRITGTSSKDGCPSVTGVLIHAVVYFMVLMAAMYFPNDTDLE